MSTVAYKVGMEYDEVPLDFNLPEFFYGTAIDKTAKILVEILDVPASASNKPYTIDQHTDTKIVHIEDLDASTDLTIKVNGDSVAFPLKPAATFSEQITAITVSNASSVNDRNLYIFTILSDE